jgi:hypothetical protein
MPRPLQGHHQGGIYKDIQVQHVNDVVEVEVYRRDISDKLLFIIDFAICWINVLHGTWITLNVHTKFKVILCGNITSYIETGALINNTFDH